eukprot:1873631-Pyramimonas_sp.AAC.1
MTSILRPGLLKQKPITEEEARGCMNVFTSLSRNDWAWEQRRRKGMHGTTLSEVPGLFGERHALPLAADSGTMVDGMLTIVVDIGSKINIIVFKRHRRSNRYPFPTDTPSRS